MQRSIQLLMAGLGLLFSTTPSTWAQPTRQTETYRRFKAYLDAIPAIDTHNHLLPYEQLRQFAPTEYGPGMNLWAIFRKSYYTNVHPLTLYKPGMSFDDWWTTAKENFVNARATSFYQYQMSAFTDLYGVDFETITDEQAKTLDRKIYDNYQNRGWVEKVITERANVELSVNDPYWSRLYEVPDYKFCALVFNVTSLVRGFHPSEYTLPPNTFPGDNPYKFAQEHKIKVESLDDYLGLVDQLFQERKAAGAVCIKSTLAYLRTIRFENVPKEQAAKIFGKTRTDLTPAEIAAFEDFIMWRLVELSAKYDLPFQIHTGYARIQGSNPMLLVDLIDANPNTKFILFHGGYPWVGDVGVIVMRYPSHVWVDSCWLPTISYSMAKRAYHEWLDGVPSNRIMWGADCNHAEGVYGATLFTRRCLAEVLAERVTNGDLREDYAKRIGRQIMRENALELFPCLRNKLWKKTDEHTAPAK